MFSSFQSLLPWLLFFSLLFTITKSSLNQSDKVNLNLYYESLCPSCQTFIVEDLIKVFKTDLNSIVNLRLVPYGNAEVEVVGPNKTITCQHGEDECYLNAIEACGISIWSDQKKHFSFIRCVESLMKSVLPHFKETKDIWKRCAYKYGGLKQIEKCYDSGLGTQLILAYANETAGLQPPHMYVPWVTINGKPLYSKYKYFVAKVCKAYKGRVSPIACRSFAPVPKPVEEELPLNQACYVGEARN